jgi:hypothetical protein
MDFPEFVQTDENGKFGRIQTNQYRTEALPTGGQNGGRKVDTSCSNHFRSQGFGRKKESCFAFETGEAGIGNNTGTLSQYFRPSQLFFIPLGKEYF